jgi:signal transduction histidine kinase
MEGFCYTIAHDLRAPLRAVSGLTSALIEEYVPNLDKNGHEIAGRITGAARRMDRLIEELLAFGRLSNSDLPKRTVDLEAVFARVVAQLQDEIEESKGMVTIDQPLPPVLANPTIVEQIATNLIGNALKFVPAQVQPRVGIRAERRGPMVRVWVEDNGIGIEAAYHKKIFGLFERLHSDKQYRGTGLGLAIVQKGVERMGGGAGVESNPGLGSRFWVELPEAK